ncbi:MAG TPA: cbb3-type cytochrome oxidase assembly protein CcoS [Thermodesulfobacteriota bacterium]|nr:cbb3-type cytochrome oxidase assembly protein CcoS [Thermodesulfobacteriota bacterium]
MYFSGWMVLVAVSLWISLTAFLWGLQSGQFSDQERARYLPLRGALPQPLVNNPARRPLEVYVLLSIGMMVLLGLAGSIFLSVYRLRG